MNLKSLLGTLIVAMTVSFSTLSHAQSIVSEDFTGTTTNSQWFFFNGACLTAGSVTSLASPGYVPGCATVMGSYYGAPNANTGKTDAALVGGQRGYLGSTTPPTTPSAIVPDDNGQGALRFTNGSPYGFQQRGAIVSDYTFPTTQGVQITFKTVAYLGSGDGSGKDGADGISFYLLDGCMPVAGGAAPSGCSASPIYGSAQTFPAIGATGGSLAYSCSNSNYPFDGLVGGYLGLGVDEYGNFLNGWVNTLGETGSTGSSGVAGSYNDNTASGGLYQPGRIGLRGAGSVSWQALTTAYGTLSSNGPYYPSSLTSTCSNGGTYSSSTNSCGVVCSAGTLNAAGNTCDSCAAGYTFSSSGNTCGRCNAGATYDATTNSCSPAGTCSSGTYNASNNTCSTICTGSSTFNATATKCGVCSSGTIDWSNYTTSGKAFCDNVCTTGTYEAAGTAYPAMCLSCTRGGTPQSTTSGGVTTWSCSTGTLNKGNLATATLSNPTSVTPTPTLATQTPTTVSPTTGAPIFTSAVQKTCSSGHLWNYTNVTNPTDAGPATLPTDPTNPNTLNTAGILDYNAIPTAYSVIPTTGPGAFKIAAEGSTTRGSAAPILYNLKITQDGLLSLSYSYNGGTSVPVINSQKITNSNGPLPSSFRFGFAGSTGGSTNVHEILCFKAAPVQSSSSSGAVNVYQNPLIRTGTQIFLANYFPSDWTGQLEAFPIGVDSTGAPVVMAPAWDARCVLSGVDKATSVCDSTGASGPAAESPGSRVMLTWDPVGQTAEAFEWGSLTPAQQTTLSAVDGTGSNRVSYLRGVTSNEITTSGTGTYRARDAILGDIVDSSPTWIGPPQNPYTLVSSWVDQLYPLASQPEDAASVQTYLQYMTPQSTTGTPPNPNGEQQRTNVVYAGANDGFLHGFRAGALDVNGNLVSTSANDGQEVLAYMPAAVLNNIHPVDANGNIVAQLDYSNTQYSHNWYVDATPAEGDVFYNNLWHTWVVSGLGPGGAAIFALDVTDPTQFGESNASKTVIGEWTPTTLTCPQQTVTACGVNLGNTYGTPQIRRFHSGQWGFIFGNGYGTANGASGIYIALLDKSTGKPTFYYLPTSLKPNAATPNGIAYPSSADFDLDHTVDYIYAGDLLGNVWRFDVTSQNPGNWGVSASSPLFTAGGPITTQVTVSTVKTIATVTNSVGLDISDAPQRVIINFGTGRQIPQTLTSATQYANGPQYLYGLWDWDFGYAPSGSTSAPAGSWNALSPNQQAVALAPTQTIVAPGTGTNLQVQTITTSTVGTGSAAISVRSMSHNPVCWKGDTACGGGGSQTQFGWYVQLPGQDEQVIFDPTYSPDGEFVVSTFVPAVNSVLSCKVVTATGFSMGLDPLTGAGSPTPFFNVGGTAFDGVQLNGTGTPSFISSGQASDHNAEYLLTQTSSGTPATPQQVNRNAIVTGQRLNWIQRR